MPTCWFCLWDSITLKSSRTLRGHAWYKVFPYPLFHVQKKAPASYSFPEFQKGQIQFLQVVREGTNRGSQGKQCSDGAGSWSCPVLLHGNLMHIWVLLQELGPYLRGGWVQACGPQTGWNQRTDDWDSWTTILLTHHQPIEKVTQQQTSPPNSVIETLP